MKTITSGLLSLGASISKVHGQMPVDRYNQAFSDAHSTKYSDKFKEDELGSLWLKFDIT